MPLVFDGENIWSVNQFDHNATRLSLDGESIGTYSVSALSRTLAFDGERVWTSGCWETLLYRLDVDGNTIDHVETVGSGPIVPFFDGEHIWTANSMDGE